MLELSTARLLLRHFQLEDAKEIHQAVFADPDVMRFGDGPQTFEWTRSWIQMCQQEYYESRGYGPYAVIEQAKQVLIGYCGLFYFPDVNGTSEVELGYRLARSAWGKGYATEVATAVRDHAFATLRISRLISIIDPSNTASIRVAEKIGMHYEGAVMLEGYTHPDLVYSMARV